MSTPTTGRVLGSLAGSSTAWKVIAGVVVAALAWWLIGVQMPTDAALALLQQASRQQLAEQLAHSNTSCAATGADQARDNLSGGQVTAGRSIWQVTRTAGLPDRAAVVAIATAMQESQLGADPSITTPNPDGDAGVFQQRTLPGWYGTIPQILDVTYAATTFLTGHTVTADQIAQAIAAGTRPAGPVGYHIPGLVDVAGWESMPVSQAAQAVQRSAFPDAYAQWEQLATGLVAFYSSSSGTDTTNANVEAIAGQCGSAGAMQCPASGLQVEAGLTPDAIRVLRCVHQRYPTIRDFFGIGDRPSAVDDDHQTGRAVDVMLPDWQGTGKQLGDQIAAWVWDNRAALGVKYVIWNARIISVARISEGWRDYLNPTGARDATSQHLDHVHVSVYGNAAGTGDTGPVVTPVASYVITATFGECSTHWAACHTGLDFAAPEGTPVRAVTPGTVTYAGWGGSYGNVTRITAADGTETWYAHQSAQTITAGQTVTAGQTIGAVGSTGNTTGPHLHLEVRIGGKPVDPATWLASKGVIV